MCTVSCFPLLSMLSMLSGSDSNRLLLLHTHVPSASCRRAVASCEPCGKRRHVLCGSHALVYLPSTVWLSHASVFGGVSNVATACTTRCSLLTSVWSALAVDTPTAMACLVMHPWLSRMMQLLRPIQDLTISADFDGSITGAWSANPDMHM
jgi:hypothetical protein